jgi:hypothetical protein
VKSVRVVGLTVALFLACVAPAGADASWYYNAVFNGQIQCAGGSANASNNGYNIAANGSSYAGKDIYCSNAFSLPAGWIGTDLVVQRACLGGAWANIGDSGMLYNAGTTNINTLYGGTAGLTFGCTYRAVVYHRVAVGGGWQNGVHWTAGV